MIHPPQNIVAGQMWYPRDGSGRGVQIMEIKCTGHGGWDYDVSYNEYDDQNKPHFHRKNVYFFQVSYFNAELEARAPSLNEVQRKAAWSKR
jgi:hypothetical protein